MDKEKTRHMVLQHLASARRVGFRPHHLLTRRVSAATSAATSPGRPNL